MHGPVSPEQSCNHNWVYPVIQPYHSPLIIVESPSAENLSNSLTLSTSLLYSVNNSPTSLILSSSTLHSINFFFSDGSNLALLSPNETPDVIADVDAGAVTGIKSLWDNSLPICCDKNGEGDLERGKKGDAARDEIGDSLCCACADSCRFEKFSGTMGADAARGSCGDRRRSGSKSYTTIKIYCFKSEVYNGYFIPRPHQLEHQHSPNSLPSSSSVCWRLYRQKRRRF